jgi:hypothetical protein
MRYVLTSSGSLRRTAITTSRLSRAPLFVNLKLVVLSTNLNTDEFDLRSACMLFDVP